MHRLVISLRNQTGVNNTPPRPMLLAGFRFKQNKSRSARAPALASDTGESVVRESFLRGPEGFFIPDRLDRALPLLSFPI